MKANSLVAFHASDSVFAVLFVICFIAGASLIKEPNRRNFMAIMIGGAGAAYLSGGGFGIWEVVFTAVVTYCAYRGLRSYNYVGVGWILHTIWDLAHHFYGHPILPFVPNSSAGCAISDALLAIWFFAGAPSIFDLKRSIAAR